MKRLVRIAFRVLMLPVVLVLTAILTPFAIHAWAFERSSIAMVDVKTGLKSYFKNFFK